jgi:serine protease Do
MLSVVEIKIKVSGYGPRADDTSSQVIERQRAIGSGVMVSADGYIITNNHVVAGAQRIRVILAPATVELVTYHTSLAHRQRAYEARLIGASRKVDLALIKIEESLFRLLRCPSSSACGLDRLGWRSDLPRDWITPSPRGS